MRVFVAGGSGTIGVPLVRALVAAGHQVSATTRSNDKRALLEKLGAAPVIVDALDKDALRAAVVHARPSHVIHQLTALPKNGPRSIADLEATNRLRVDGTRNLIAASVEAGARRIIGGSFALLPGAGRPASANAAVAAVQSMESQILDANRSGRVEGIVLRYGLFYGAENPSTVDLIERVRRRRMPAIRGDQGLLPYIHLDDAVAATLAALEHGTPGGIYDVVDDRPTSMTAVVQAIAAELGAPAPRALPLWLLRWLSPYMANFVSMRVPLSNAKARAELHWQPAYPSWREGLRQTLGHAA